MLLKRHADKVLYSIEVHSFYKGTVPDILEARILQDAERLDAIGSIGTARSLLWPVHWEGAFFSFLDPFCRTRRSEDERWALEHFRDLD